MSGTYNSGSNTATPGNSTTTPGTTVPNMGDGTISSISQGTVTSTGNYAAGVVTASVTGTSTGAATIVFTADLLSTSAGSGGGTQSNTQTVTTSTTGTTLTMGNIGTTLTILNDSASPFHPNDGFTIYNSQLGQNSSDIPLDLTGISVTVQQFPTMANPAKWGQSIQNMFNYCGANPGIIGVIPPGFYDCSDVASLYIVSNMTIRAYGAVMFTSTSSTGDGGFVTVSNITSAIDTTSGIHNVTIMGGTWGGAGLNGALCTDNSQRYPTTGTMRTGHVFSLFANRDVSLIDVTVRGWSQGAAFYLFSNNSTTPNNSLTLRNCSFWNSDGAAGSDGIRVANGNGVLITNSNGICGGNALQFSPPSVSGLQQGIGIANAYFIGGNVQSITGHAIAAMTQDSAGSGFVTTATIAHVGFIGIVGTVGPTSTAAAYINNGNSTGAIQDVTISGGKLTGDPTPSYSGTPTIGLLTVQSSQIGTTTTLAGGVFDVFVSDVSLVNPTNNTVYVSGPATGTSTPPVSVKNVNFRNCVFEPLLSVVGTLTATAYIEGCIGYSFRNCTFAGSTSANFTGKSLYLGASPASTLTTSASFGVIDGCSFFTNSTTAVNQPPVISVMRGDMNAIQGWTKFFFGPDPTILSGLTTPPMAAEGILIARIAKNTFIDCVDFRGLLNSTPVNNLAGAMTNNTRLGLNILTTAPSTTYPVLETGGLTLSKSQISAADMSMQTWPAQSIVLELISSTGTDISITLILPTPSADGEFRVLSAPKNKFGVTLATGSMPVYGLPSSILAGTSVRLIYDIGGYWFVA